MRDAEDEVRLDLRHDDTPIVRLLLDSIAEVALGSGVPSPPPAPPPSLPPSGTPVRPSPPASYSTAAARRDFLTPRSSHPAPRPARTRDDDERRRWRFLKEARVDGDKLTHAVELLAFTVVWAPGVQLSPAHGPCSLLRGFHRDCYREVKGQRGRDRSHQFLAWSVSSLGTCKPRTVRHHCCGLRVHKMSFRHSSPRADLLPMLACACCRQAVVAPALAHLRLEALRDRRADAGRVFDDAVASIEAQERLQG